MSEKTQRFVDRRIYLWEASSIICLPLPLPHGHDRYPGGTKLKRYFFSIEETRKTTTEKNWNGYTKSPQRMHYGLRRIVRRVQRLLGVVLFSDERCTKRGNYRSLFQGIEIFYSWLLRCCLVTVLCSDRSKESFGMFVCLPCFRCDLQRVPSHMG